MYNQSWLEKINRKLSRYAIRNLMLYIVIGMGLVFIIDLAASMQTEFSLSSLIMFNRDAIFQGQVWRILSFIFFPPSSSIFFIIISLYFYWLIGSALEQEWGSFRFNLFYFCGMLGTIIAGLITGYATNYYLNLSLFLAFALLYPNYEFMLFFFIPIKAKYLAFIDAIGLIILLITDRWEGKIVLIISLINIVLFFGKSFISRIKNAYRRYKWKKSMK